MKSMCAVLATALVLGACSHNDILGIELEIKSDEVKFMPMSVEAGESRSQCPPEHARINLC